MKKVKDIMYPDQGMPYALFTDVEEMEFIERSHGLSKYYGGTILYKNLDVNNTKVFVQNSHLDLEHNLAIEYNYETKEMKIFYIYVTFKLNREVKDV